MKNRNCRAPDASFVPKARLEAIGFRPRSRNFFPGAPDLAIEVLAPRKRRPEVERRLKDFFSSGTKLAWIIDPEEECAEVCHSLTDRRLVGPGGVLDGEQLLPGFKLPLDELFKDSVWE